MRGSGNEEFDHIVFGGLVNGQVPEVAAVTCAAGSEPGCGVAKVVVARNRNRNGEGGVIKEVLSRRGEFFFDRLGWKMLFGADGTEVGNDAEDAFGLLVSLIGGR